MMLWRWAVPTILVMLAASGCTTTTPDSARTATAPGSVVSTSIRLIPAVAYLNSDGLWVADSRGQTQLIDDDIDLTTAVAEDGAGIAWSSNGRLISVVGKALLRQYDLASGARRSWPCGCRSAAYLGDDLVAATADGTGLYRFGNPDRPPVRVPLVGVPPGSVAAVLAGGKSAVLLNVTEMATASAYGGPSQLYLVDASGRGRQIATPTGNTPLRRARTAPDGRRIAVDGTEHGGYCANYSFVTIVDLVTGFATTPTMPDSGPWYVVGLDWSLDTTLTISLATAACTADASPVPALPLLHTVSGDAWVATGEAALGQVRQNDATTWTLSGGVRTDPISAQPRQGDLTLVRSDKSSSVIGHRVTQFVLAPLPTQ